MLWSNYKYRLHIGYLPLPRINPVEGLTKIAKKKKKLKLAMLTHQFEYLCNYLQLNGEHRPNCL